MMDLRRRKEEIESEIEFKDEKINLLAKENIIRKEQIDNLENKLINIQNAVEFKLNIEYIQSEAQKLDFSKYQPEEKLDIYEQKFKELEQANSTIVEELQKYKRESLGFEEVLKEREERIIRVKSLLTEVQNSHKILDKQYSMLKLDHERAISNYNEQKIELDDTINKLKMTNKARNENEIKLNEELEKEKELKALLGEKEERIQKYINEIQKLEKQLFNMRKEKESLDSEKVNDNKHFEIQKRQYVEKITSLNEIITNEKETREMWVERFNKEQNAHNNTKNENLKLRNRIKDLDVEIQNMGIRNESEERLKKQFEESNNLLHKKCSDLIAANENAEREVNTMKILLKNMEESKAGEMKKYKESIMKENEKIQTIKENLYMEIEDMHAKSAEVYRKYVELLSKFSSLMSDHQISTYEISKLKDLLQRTEGQRVTAQESLEETAMILSEYQELYNMQIEQEKKMEKSRDELDKQLKKLERESKKKDAKLKEMNDIKEKLRVNEQKLEELQDANIKSFDDVGTQTAQFTTNNIDTQTEMTLKQIDNLEQNLESTKKEKNKYMLAVKNYTSKIRKTPESGSKSPNKSDADEVEEFADIDPNIIENEEDNEQAEEVDEKLLEELRLAKEKKIAAQKEKLQKREEEYKKRLKDKRKIKDDAAYSSLAVYQQKRQNDDGTIANSLTNKDRENSKEGSGSPKRQKSVDPSPTAPSRQTIEINANKEKILGNLTLGVLNINNRNLNNSFINESAEDSYSKEDIDVIRKPNIVTDEEYDIVDIPQNEINKTDSVVSPNSIEQTMDKDYLDTYRDRNKQRTVVGSRGSNYSQHNIQVKGKASIKTLIRVAATRK